MFEALKFLSLITGWIAGGGLIVLGALAVGWYLPAVRQLAIAVAVVALSSTFFLAKGVHLGISLEAARWKAAETRAVDNGNKARAGAISDVESGSVPDDRFNRDP